MRYDEPLLTDGEDKTLARAVEAGLLADACLTDPAIRPLAGDATDRELELLRDAGAAARERLVLANLRLVHALAGDAARRWGLPFDDLFSEGTLGLLDAVPRYDPEQDLSFGRFAAVCIRHRLQGAVATRCGQLHVTRSQAATARAQGVEVQAPQALVPEIDVVAVGPEGDAPAEAARLLDGLPRLEREVLERRFGIRGKAMSQRDVGRQLGIGRHTVRMLESSGLERLRAQAADAEAVLLAA